MAGNSRDRQMLTWPPQPTSGTIPAAIPPHAPLQSGGWYRSLVRREVLGPGRYPIDFTGRKSMGTALALAAFFGPVGLCYVSMTTGLTATLLAATILAISDAGLVPLLVVWPATLAWAAGASSWGVVGRWDAERAEPAHVMNDAARTSMASPRHARSPRWRATGSNASTNA